MKIVIFLRSIGVILKGNVKGHMYFLEVKSRHIFKVLVHNFLYPTSIFNVQGMFLVLLTVFMQTWQTLVKGAESFRKVFIKIIHSE